jgi:hypothetical protein
MASQPEFPEFKPIQLEDRDFIQEILWKYQPQTSQWTFTNLFLWRTRYGFQWSIYRDWLLVLCTANTNSLYALQPVGPPSRLALTRMLLQYLEEEKEEKEPRIERADQKLIAEIKEARDFLIEPTREHFDYVYRSKDLIELAGRKYHSKRNHINKFLRSYSFNYASLNEDHGNACLELTESWCQLHRCEEDLSLLEEWEAVHGALIHFRTLKLQGGVILMGNKVEAFALGELLNNQTAVVHIEKADPKIPGLYALINQQFCERSWQNVPYVNREQDLGEPGLRKAKLSYHPEYLAETFRIGPRNDAGF